MSATGSIALGLKSATLGASASPLPPQATDDGTELLTGALVRGDEDAFRTLHAQYHDRLWRYLLTVCRGNEDQARDALQESWLRVVRHARRLPSEADLWRWLAALARCAAIDGSRRHRRYGTALSRYLDWFRHSAPTESVPAEDPLDRLDDLLEDGLNELEPSDRELLVQRYRHARSVRELAALAGISEKAMESRLGRLRALLRGRLLTKLSHETSSPH